MIPMQLLTLEKTYGKNSKYNQRYRLLYHLQLHQIKRPAVPDITDTVGRHLATILKQGNPPRYQYHYYQRCSVRYPLQLLHLQVSVPCKCHKDIADYQQQYRQKYIHNSKPFFRAKVIQISLFHTILFIQNNFIFLHSHSVTTVFMHVITETYCYETFKIRTSI